MKDAIGQEIKVGDSVAHANSKGGGIGGIYPVVKVSESRATVMKVPKYSRELARVPLDPKHLIVVTDNLEVLRGFAVVIGTHK